MSIWPPPLFLAQFPILLPHTVCSHYPEHDPMDHLEGFDSKLPFREPNPANILLQQWPFSTKPVTPE